MKTTTVSVLAGVAVSLFAYIVLVERHQLTDIELEGRGARLIERFSQRRVQEVSIERGGERITLAALEREGDEEAEEERVWELREPLAARGDSTAVSTLLGALEWAEPRRTIEGATAADLAEYGLSEPAIRVTLRIADETVTLSIGNRDATPCWTTPPWSTWWARTCSRRPTTTLRTSATGRSSRTPCWT